MHGNIWDICIWDHQGKQEGVSHRMKNSNLECRDAKQVQHENMVITDWNDNKPLSMYMYILDHFFSQCFQQYNC